MKDYTTVATWGKSVKGWELGMGEILGSMELYDKIQNKNKKMNIFFLKNPLKNASQKELTWM